MNAQTPMNHAEQARQYQQISGGSIDTEHSCEAFTRVLDGDVCFDFHATGVSVYDMRFDESDEISFAEAMSQYE